METELVTAPTERDAARKKVIKASAKVRVQKVHWRQALTGVSGRSFELAKKKAKDPPHGPLFKVTPAAKAKKFGADRAVEFGKTVLSKGYEFAMAALDERRRVTLVRAHGLVRPLRRGRHVRDRRRLRSPGGESPALRPAAGRLTIEGRTVAPLVQLALALRCRAPTDEE